ncbi:MAG: helix-turn-helix domain-containing protein [Eubacteriales bacterium]|nr:helix-turn-helix domain-containing protein [Eubacteriales bacterium]
MNETMGRIIMRLRKDRGLTQEQLANELGISYQAVSKWETGNSCPDLAVLPLLADLFGVSIDTLFGRAKAEVIPVEAGTDGPSFPWPDDEGFYAVLYHGHELIGSQSEAERVFRFQYEGPAQNVSCSFDLEISGEVSGNAAAGGDLTCGAVYGFVEAGGDVTCDSVSGNVRAGGDVTCDNVRGNVTAGGDVTCDDVDGSVTAGGDVTCDEIAGSAFAGESVHSEHLDLNMDGDIPGQLGEEFARGIGNLSAWGADLGRRIADAVEKGLGRAGRPSRPDEEDEDDE